MVGCVLSQLRPAFSSAKNAELLSYAYFAYAYFIGQCFRKTSNYSAKVSCW